MIFKKFPYSFPLNILIFYWFLDHSFKEVSWLITKGKERMCKNCQYYDTEKQVCKLFHRKLPPHYYCVVDGNMVFFLENDH
jgi:hypothetical protein